MTMVKTQESLENGTAEAYDTGYLAWVKENLFGEIEFNPYRSDIEINLHQYWMYGFFEARQRKQHWKKH